MKMNNEIQTECLFQDVISILRRIYIYIYIYKGLGDIYNLP